MGGAADHDCLQFADFTLDRADERLIGPRGPVRLGHKAFRVLSALLAEPGRLLTKDDLFEHAWDGTIVSESALTSVIKELRRALEDDPKSPRFIESVYGRGYRFIAPVNGAASRPAPSQAPEPSSSAAICVLPFANISGDAEQEYFSDGISEDVTTDLSKFSALHVVARNTAFQFKGQPVDVGAVAAKLGVTHVLEGSVRKVGNRVRISAQLIDGRSGGHIWAERYDRDLTDIFEIQDEISRAIVEALRIKLLPEEKQALEDRQTSSVEAYNLYLMARQLWISGSHGDRRREERVIRLCERAVELDPRYARAWALLAIARSNLHYGFGEAELPDGVEEAERALGIDAHIAEAFCPRVRRYSEQGKLDEAEQAIGIALELDPESWEVNKEAARLFYGQRRIEEAARHFQKAADVMETDYHAYSLLFSCYDAMGDQKGKVAAAETVIARVERALREDAFNGHALSLGAASLALLGEMERSREWVERALLVDPQNVNLRYNFACMLATAGKDPEAALKLFADAMAMTKGATVVKGARTDPDLDSLRDDPRFEQALSAAERRLGLERRP